MKPSLNRNVTFSNEDHQYLEQLYWTLLIQPLKKKHFGPFSTGVKFLKGTVFVTFTCWMAVVQLCSEQFTGKK